MEQIIQKSAEEYGLIGLCVAGAAVIIWKIIVSMMGRAERNDAWMQARMDAKDTQLAEQHDKALEVSNSVIRLADETATRTAQALAALTEEIKGMRTEVCDGLASLRKV